MKTAIIAALLLLSVHLSAQNSINLDDAIERITTKHPSILQQDLYVQQQQILKDAGKNQPFFGVGYTIEEFGPGGFGIQSIYFQQNFNMPQIAKRKAIYQEALAKGGDLQKQATQRQLKRFVSSLYQQLLYYKTSIRLNTELQENFDQLLQIAKRRQAVGETGELPVLTIQSQQQQLELKQMNHQQNFLVQLEVLQQFLMDSTIQDISDEGFLPFDNTLVEVDLASHPLVLQIDQSMVANAAQSQVIKSQLLPQISVGFQTQMVQRDFPYFGAQIGVNVPLFRKGVNAQVKANDLNRKILAENKNWQLQQLSGQQKIAQQKIEQLQLQIKHIEETMLPVLKKQQEMSYKAYQLGELNYQNVLLNNQQLIQVRTQKLQLIFQLNLARIDYQYLGN